MPKQKDISISPKTDTEKELVRELLSKNRGLAIADAHPVRDAYNFLDRNIGEMAKHRVRTLYVECVPPGIISELAKLSVKELEGKKAEAKDMVSNKKNPKYADAQYAIESAASIYQHAISRAQIIDISLKLYDLAILAKKHGMRLAEFDSAEGVVGSQMDLQKRLTSSDISWAATIEVDQKEYNSQGKDKFVVFAGHAHFLSSSIAKGLVDEKLGIPVISPTWSEKSKLFEKGFEVATEKNMADFWINAGNKAFPAKELMKAEISTIEKFGAKLREMNSEGQKINYKQLLEDYRQKGPESPNK